MYAVYDSDRPAKYPECGVHPSWKNNRFNKLEDAIAYANNWLDGWAHVPENLKFENKEWRVNYGMDNYLIIREEAGLLYQYKEGETCKYNRNLSYVDRLHRDKNGFMTPTCKELDVLIVPTEKAKEVADALNAVLGGTLYPNN